MTMVENGDDMSDFMGPLSEDISETALVPPDVASALQNATENLSDVKDVPRSNVSSEFYPTQLNFVPHDSLAATGILTENAAPFANQYRVLDRLGEGGSGEVFAAVRRKDGELCALKQLRHELHDHPTALSRFKREARVVSQLSHPNIARVLEATQEGDAYCIATELVPGVDFESIIHTLYKQEHLLSAGSAAALILPILDALTYAHDVRGPDGPLNLVHRDLSAKNVMFTFSGQVKVIDFGVAQAEGDSFETSPEAMVGTLRALSPEQALGLSTDRRTDIYAVGVLFYELLTTQPVVQTAQPLIAAVQEIATRSAPPPSTINPMVSPSVDRLVLCALSKAPEDRFQDAGSFARAIRETISEISSIEVLQSLLKHLFEDERQRWLDLEARARALVQAEDFEAELKISGTEWEAVSQVVPYPSPPWEDGQDMAATARSHHPSMSPPRLISVRERSPSISGVDDSGLPDPTEIQTDSSLTWMDATGSESLVPPPSISAPTVLSGLVDPFQESTPLSVASVDDKSSTLSSITEESMTPAIRKKPILSSLPDEGRLSKSNAKTAPALGPRPPLPNFPSYPLDAVPQPVRATPSAARAAPRKNTDFWLGLVLGIVVTSILGFGGVWLLMD